MARHIIPVILSGGSGSRLWPLSRTASPKQLLALTSDETLLQQTVRRALRVSDSELLIVVTNYGHRLQIAEQLQVLSVKKPQILLEPIGRNTAPAIALAAFEAMQHDQDALLLVLPSDHLLRDKEAFAAAVNMGRTAAEQGQLVAFGIQPTMPATGYGYIKAQSNGISRIERFVEKPDINLAKQFLKQGGYYWNSGMFLFTPQNYLAELEQHAPDVFMSCQKTHSAVQRDSVFLRVPEAEFSQCQSISVDYAVFEQTSQAMLVPLDCEWSDLGSWWSLWNTQVQDANGNVCIGDALLQDTHNCYVRTDGRLVGVLGVNDHIIIETADAVLVANRDHAESVKQLVDELKALGREEVDQHKKVKCSWGEYEILDDAQQFNVRRITLKPGSELSSQKNQYCIRHWVIVQGIANLTYDNQQLTLNVDESISIPLEVEYCLKNPGSENLKLIEVQMEDYWREQVKT